MKIQSNVLNVVSISFLYESAQPTEPLHFLIYKVDRQISKRFLLNTFNIRKRYISISIYVYVYK